MRKGTWLAVIVAILVVAGIVYAVTNNSSNSYKSPKSSSTSQTSSTNQSTASGDIIQTKTASSVGQYLADSSGNPLYTYGADTTGKSNCTGSCLYNWPAYDAGNAPSTLPANVTVITRDDGSKQYAYKGMPLYTFTSDSSGQVTGDGVENFHIAKP